MLKFSSRLTVYIKGDIVSILLGLCVAKCDSQFFLQTFPVCLFPSNQLLLLLLLLLLFIHILIGQSPQTQGLLTGYPKNESNAWRNRVYIIVYTGYRVQALPTCCPPPQKKRRAKAHRALGNCAHVIACMSKQILALFQLKKLKKGDIHKKNAIKGERNGPFQKGPKRAKKGEHLWERASRISRKP